MLLTDKLYNPDLIENIDDCYIDKEEKDERIARVTHQKEKKIL